jgi:hypothetical protein
LVATTSTSSQDVEAVFRKTLEYEGLPDLQQLVLNRRLLREELARPKTGSTPLLVITKLAIVEIFIHYAIYRLALREKSPIQAQLLEYHSAEISRILDEHFTDIATTQRANLSISDPLNYTREDHMTVLSVFAWMKAKQRSVTKDNHAELESDLPRIAFNLPLPLPSKLKKTKKRHDAPVAWSKKAKRRRKTKRARDSSSSSGDSSSESSSDDENSKEVTSAKNNLFKLHQPDVFPGRFTLPEGAEESEFPPGFFDPMVDCQETPTSMTFQSYFDTTKKPGFPRFSGDPTKSEMSFPAFFERFRKMVHLKRGDKVDHSTKYTILLSLMEPSSRAHRILAQFENCTDMEDAYLHGVHQLWREYGSDNEKLLSSAKIGLKTLKPASAQRNDQLDFAYDVVKKFTTMVQSGLTERAAAKKAFKHLWKYLDPAVVTLFTIETGISRGQLKTYWKGNPKTELIEVPATLRDIFATLEDDEEGDISLSAPVTKWQKKPSGSEPTNSAPRATHAQPYDSCIFCKTKDHNSFTCPKTVEERRKLALQRSKCINCIAPTCPGGEACTARYFCKHCAEKYPDSPKHSGYLCTRSDNPRFSNGKVVLDRQRPAAPAETPSRPSSSGKTWTKNPKPNSYVAKTDTHAASIAASVASLQEAVRDIKQHHEKITAETTVKSADKVLEN